MQLNRIEIEGYRSIRTKLDLHVDPRVTVILGANDHGKTNVLECLLHLNTDRPFDAERDLNWDSENRPGDLPHIVYWFALSDNESGELYRTCIRSKYLPTLTENTASKKANLDRAITETNQITREIATVNSALRDLAADQSEKRKAAKQSPSDNELKAAVEQAAEACRAQEIRKADLEERLQGAQENADAAQSEWLWSSVQELEMLAIANGHHGDVESCLEVARKAWTNSKTEIDKLGPQINSAETALNQAKSSGDQDQINKANESLNSLREREKSLNEKYKMHADHYNRIKNTINFIKSDTYKKGRQKNMGNFQLPDRLDNIALERKGVSGDLQAVNTKDYGDDIVFSFAKDKLPRVELIKPIHNVPDSVTYDEIMRDDFTFMRGIFYYAGIYKEAWEGVFTQSDVTTKYLRTASIKLNKTLGANWSQGKDLTFRLAHGAVTGQIDLRIEDPAVAHRDVRASRRSSGFTHFFSLKTILHAHQTESSARAFSDHPKSYPAAAK